MSRVLDRALSAEGLDVLVEAFSEDPVVRWVLPDEAAYRRGFRALCRAMAGRHQTENVVLDGAERVDVASIWLPPGEMPSAWQLVVAGTSNVSLARWPAAAALLRQMQAAKPARPHWYLATIGTRAAARGRGLGTYALRKRLDECDSARVPAYLEATSEHNKRLYERHGFETTTILRAGQSPPIWAMWREAAGAGRDER